MQTDALFSTVNSETIITNAASVEGVNVEWLPTRQKAYDFIKQQVEQKQNTTECFWIVDSNFVVKKFLRWMQLFPRVRPCFAIKCNPNHMFLRTLSQIEGVGFDCASEQEIKDVLLSGSHPSRIIFAHPQKPTTSIEYALKVGVCTMTFDSIEEARKIRSVIDTLSQQDEDFLLPQLVLRIRVPDSHSSIPLGAKFGTDLIFCADILDECIKLELQVIGISFHCGSDCHEPTAFVTAITLARQIFDLALTKGIKMHLLDIGGGFPGWDGSERVFGNKDDDNLFNDYIQGPMSSEPLVGCDQIAKIVIPVINQLFDPDVKIISEPGRYFVEGSHMYLCQIYSRRMIKSTEGNLVQVCFIGDGVTGSFKDARICDREFFPFVLPMSSESDEEQEIESHEQDNEQKHIESRLDDISIFADNNKKTCLTTIMGPTGEIDDCIIREVQLPSVNEGDWFLFPRIGAYSISLSASQLTNSMPDNIVYVAIP